MDKIEKGLVCTLKSIIHKYSCENIALKVRSKNRGVIIEINENDEYSISFDLWPLQQPYAYENHGYRIISQSFSSLKEGLMWCCIYALRLANVIHPITPVLGFIHTVKGDSPNNRQNTLWNLRG